MKPKIPPDEDESGHSYGVFADAVTTNIEVIRIREEYQYKFFNDFIFRPTFLKKKLLKRFILRMQDKNTLSNISLHAGYHFIFKN